MTRTLARRVGTETVGVEPRTGVDGQGAPTFGASQNIEARAVRASEQTINADGEDIRVDHMLWVDAGESPLPAKGDRLTVGGNTFIVEAVDDGEKLSGTLDHVKVGAREE